jgi:signal transduction histidine kinase
MCQELMNNAIKHSDAKNINIVVYCQMKNMRIEISDDGKGFEPEKILGDHLQSGNGLGNLSNRASLIGATITFDSTPGKGTTVNINIKQT